MKVKLLFFLAVIFSIICCTNTENRTNDPNITSSTVNKMEPVSLDLASLIDSAQLNTQKLDIDFDIFFESAKSYDVYPLKKLLNPTLASFEDTTDLVVTFHCTDGYKPTMSISRLFDAEAYVAIRDQDAKEGENWLPDLAPKMAPYYIVWAVDSTVAYKYPWPFGVFEVFFTDFDSKFAPIFPEDNELAQVGFYKFKDKCLKCHRINQIGGNMGPEFNYPKNITTYWQKEDIYQFALNPQSYRISSTMAGIKDLTRADFEEIYSYLEYMEGRD